MEPHEITGEEFLAMTAIVAFISMIVISFISDKGEDFAIIAFVSVVAGFAWPFTIFVTVVGGICWTIKNVVDKIRG